MTGAGDIFALGVFMLGNFMAASSGAFFRPGDWYAQLAKPVWTPPNWAFPVVWSILFVLNAVSGWLVWQAAGPSAAIALGIYASSLGINATWSAVFFGLHRMGAGMVVVVGLWLSILAVMILFAGFSPVAAALQLPYLVWVSIASALNLRVMQLNPRISASV